ncbi:succinate dehydrogenase, hydrophobic membrane anchor protein [Alterisphingorhabdus coralli]|uniref:Succinate dehydrogenase hydrophobic membrane anchor subunit n=1 Tax=Alterisphingorhabdus coralli TaxID=3071408 RepID=A0AA97I1V9_9SPHN|nr:succinate dehydrogenase, hydrophobic membrane anchor protein [Parasphingorhabdus sp. SCSIO 66989]WOE76502.1 succinate dehydrogenase, hydrophobic membrane anchor protein [Parasphingorhabdus sp. SCSIO 66989]
MSSGTQLGKVRGLGSARHGGQHWIFHRITAISNVLLFAWFIGSLLQLESYDYVTVTAWLSSPLAAVAMMLLAVSVFWHLRLGLQVLIEDYIHNHGTKFALLMLLNIYAIGGAALAIFSVAKIAFTGAL